MLSRYIRNKSITLFVSEMSELYSRRPTRERWHRLNAIFSFAKKNVSDNAFWWAAHGAETAIFETHINNITVRRIEAFVCGR